TGVLTLVSSQDLTNPSAVAQQYTYVINWGDGNVQTIQLMLKTPGAPVLSTQTTVGTLARTSGNVGAATTGSMAFTHKFLGPPDPLNPTAPIKITVTVVDDNNGTVTDSVTIANPGIQTSNVAIDTTPQVPHLDFVPPHAVQTVLAEVSAAPQSL